MKVETIVYKDGRVMQLNHVAQLVAADLYQNELHYSICEKLADQCKPSTDIRYVVVNLLSLKSLRARVITALCWYLEQEKHLVAEVHVFQDVYNVLEHLCPVTVRCNSLGSSNVPLITCRQALPILVKAILHRLYRLARRRPKAGKDILRAWVDVTQAMYPNLLTSAEVRVYPFPYGINRQYRFVMECKKNGASWSLDGLPYSIIDACRAVFSSSNREIAISHLEHTAYLLYAKEVLSWKPSAVYTSDEYEVGAVSLYSNLAGHNVMSVNTAHGIGWYCPYVAYTEFRVFNSRQGEFYRKRNRLLRTTFRKQQNVKLPIEHSDCRLSSKVAFVLVHQNFDDFNMPAEREAQLRLGKLIRVASERAAASYFVKLHPNTRPSKVAAVVESLGGEPLVEWARLAGYRPVFILINSTAYFELIEIAPVLVYNAPSFEPELYFECGYNTVNEENCPDTLVKLVDLTNWDEAFRFQARSPHDSP